MRTFAAEYLKNGRNGAEAYRTAYDVNLTPQRASEKASRLLRHPLVKPIIDAAERKAAAETEKQLQRYAVTKGRVVAELARLGFANMGDYVNLGEPDEKGKRELTLDLSKVDRDQLAAVSEITIDDEGKIKFKLHDKRGPLFDLAKIQGYVVDRHAHRMVKSFEDLSDEELDNLHTDVQARRGAGLGRARKSNRR